MLYNQLTAEESTALDQCVYMAWRKMPPDETAASHRADMSVMTFDTKSGTSSIATSSLQERFLSAACVLLGRGEDKNFTT